MMLGAGDLKDTKTEGKATMDVTSFKIRRGMQGNPIRLCLTILIPPGPSVLDSHFAYSENFICKD